MSETDILDGVGNEVVYFFGELKDDMNENVSNLFGLYIAVILVLLLVIVIAWYSTYVVEPVVQSVILVERSPVAGSANSQDAEINSNTVEEVRQAVTQFLQHQQHLDTAGDNTNNGDGGQEASEQLEQVKNNVTFRLESRFVRHS